MNVAARIIALANQKGGVGKTTTCVNLAASMVLLKQRVLLIDLDPQGNATMGSGLNKNEVEFTVGDVLQNKIPIEKSIVQHLPAGFDLLPSNIDLTEAEVNLIKKADRESRLRISLEKISTNYDFIFIDCPPALNVLTLNALFAANSIIIPMQCEYYALEGLSALINTIQDVNQVKQSSSKPIMIEGIVRTMYDSRNRLCIDVSNQLLEHFKGLVYDTVIPRNIRLAEAPSYGMPVSLYDKASKGAESYLKLAAEVLNNKKTKKNKILNQITEFSGA